MTTEIPSGDGHEPIAIDAASIPFATDGLKSPTIYADVIRGASVLGEVAKINLIEHRVDASDNDLKAVHVATLVIPVSQLQPWGIFFSQMATGAIGVQEAKAKESNGQ